MFLAREERPGATEALLMKTLPQDRPEAGFSWSARLAICSFDVAKWMRGAASACTPCSQGMIRVLSFLGVRVCDRRLGVLARSGSRETKTQGTDKMQFTVCMHYVYSGCHYCRNQPVLVWQILITNQQVLYGCVRVFVSWFVRACVLSWVEILKLYGCRFSSMPYIRYPQLRELPY